MNTESITFTADYKTNGFKVDFPEGSLKDPKFNELVSQQYKEFLNSGVEKSKNAGDNLTKVLIGLGFIAASYFSGKYLSKENDKLTLDKLKSMSLEDAAKWIHDANLSDLENICESDKDFKDLYDFTVEAVSYVTQENFDWENWYKTSKGFKEFVHKVPKSE